MINFDAYIKRVVGDSYWTGNTIHGIELCPGVSEKCTSIKLWDGAVHATLGGSLNVASEEVMTNMLLAAAMKYSPEELKIELLTRNNNTRINTLARLPHVKVYHTMLIEEDTVEFLSRVLSSMGVRQKLLQKYDSPKIEDLRQDILTGYERTYNVKANWVDAIADEDIREEDYARHLIVISDCAQLIAKDAVAQDKLNFIYKVGRSLGYHLLFVQSNMQAELLVPEIRDMCSVRIGMKCKPGVLNSIFSEDASPSLNNYQLVSNRDYGKNASDNIIWEWPECSMQQLELYINSCRHKFYT